jgi:hypothetical protein
MKFLKTLTAVIVSVAILTSFPAYTCGGVAGASAWVTSSTSTAFSSINANNAKHGGYSLSCTGNTSRSLSFTGSTYDSLNIYYNSPTDRGFQHHLLFSAKQTFKLKVKGLCLRVDKPCGYAGFRDVL